MYWEKKIMHALFEERAVKGIIDYARVFANVCSPRPYFQRNPYHLGFNLWCHIEQLYRDGKVSLDYQEEIDRDKKNRWSEASNVEPRSRVLSEGSCSWGRPRRVKRISSTY